MALLRTQKYFWTLKSIYYALSYQSAESERSACLYRGNTAALPLGRADSEAALLQECTNIFSSGGGLSLAELSQVPFLGRLPIDPKIVSVPLQSELKRNPTSPTAEVFKSIVEKITGKSINV